MKDNGNLQAKFLKNLIFPMMSLLFLTAVGSFLLIYLVYIDYIEYIVDEMEDDEIEVLKTLSHYSALTLGQWMDYANIYMLLAHTSTYDILVGKIPIKRRFATKNYANAVEVAEGTYIPPGWDSSTNSSYDISMWYINPYTKSDNITYNIQTDLRFSTMMDSYNKPIGRTSPFVDQSLESLYVTFNHTGLMYTFPCLASETFVNTSYVYEDQCKYVQPNPEWFDPRCRDWYSLTVENHQKSITITEPYVFATSNRIGQTVCFVIYDAQDSYEPLLVECLDYTLEKLHAQLILSYFNSSYTTGYSYSSNETLLYHSRMFEPSQNDDDFYSISHLEFPGGTQEEIQDWENRILPLFKSDKPEFDYYYANNKKVFIAITPVYYKINLDGSSSQYGGYGIRVAIDAMRSNYEKLQDSCMKTLFVMILVFIPLVISTMVVCYILCTYQINNLLRPLNRLVEILDRMMNGELEIQEFSNKRKVCIEVIQLYNVFDRLRILLRLRSYKYYANDAQALIMYSQALLLFKDFGNKSGTALCWYNIGVINYKSQRYEEAADALYNSIQECGIERSRSPREELNFMRRIEFYIKALRALHKNQESLYFLYLLAEYYKNNSKDLHDILRVLMQIIEINSILNQESTELLNDMEVFIHTSTYSTMPSSIVSQVLLYCQALNFIVHNKYKDAANLLTDVLDSYELYCPELRNKVLGTLQFVFQKVNCDVCIDSILSYCQYQGKDVMMLIDCSESMNEDLMNTAKACFTNLYFRAVFQQDRVSCIFFNEELNFVTRLSMLSSTADIFLQKLRDGFEIKGRCALYDAIMSSINDCRTFSGHLSITSQSMDIKETLRDNWIIVLISGPDTASRRTQSDIIETLITFKIGIVLIGFQLSSSVQEAYQTLVENYNRAYFLNCNTSRELSRAFELVTSIICGKTNLI